MGKNYVFGDVMIGKEEIQKRVSELGKEISRDYKDDSIVAICVLKGAVIFISDLIRNKCRYLRLISWRYRVMEPLPRVQGLLEF